MRCGGFTGGADSQHLDGHVSGSCDHRNHFRGAHTVAMLPLPGARHLSSTPAQVISIWGYRGIVFVQRHTASLQGTHMSVFPGKGFTDAFRR